MAAMAPRSSVTTKPSKPIWSRSSASIDVPTVFHARRCGTIRHHGAHGRQWPRLTDTPAKLTDMSHEHPALGDRPARIPTARRPQREVGIRELRNAGKVVADLAGAGAVGRVTSGGRLVGWLVPATPAEQRADELEARGKLRPGRSGGLADRRPLPRRADTPPLSATLEQLRHEEGQ